MSPNRRSKVTDRQTHRHRQTDKDRWTDRQTDRQIGLKTGIQLYERTKYNLQT